MNRADIYDRDYYEYGITVGKSLYNNYRWLPERTCSAAMAVIDRFKIEPKYSQDAVLDYGCAKGFYVRAFRILHRTAYGIDISKYAIENAPLDTKPYVSLVNDYKEGKVDFPKSFSLIFCKNVFEQVPYEEIIPTLKFLRDLGSNMFFVVSIGEDEKYLVPDYEKDTANLIREPLAWWYEKLRSVGFIIISVTTEFYGITDQWDKEKKGTAFFICR